MKKFLSRKKRWGDLVYIYIYSQILIGFWGSMRIIIQAVETERERMLFSFV